MEHFSRLKHPESKTNVEAEQLLLDLQDKIESGEIELEQDRLERLEEVANQTLSVIARSTAIASLTAACGLTINHQSTRYEISADTINGENIYQHEDARTTNILNYLTGKHALPEGEKIHLYRMHIRNLLESNHFPLPEDLHEYNKEQLDALVLHWKNELSGGDVVDAESVTDQLFKEAITSPLGEHGEEIYNKIWELQKKVGAPKIRWATERTGVVAKVVASSAGEDRAFYNPIENTIYLSYAQSGKRLIEESTHAHQFNSDPIGSYHKLAGSWLRTAERAIMSGTTFKESYRDEYTREHSLEHEAHNEIELEFKSQLGISDSK